ncbi:MAG: hypothetical protein ACI9PU_002020 [Ascidiaceihabitans sp.]|jgi:hypothetical protein|tara:strand:- start:2157 stop:2639 length:483 start_codon:yes stop_codon:yes gene_type:complete
MRFIALVVSLIAPAQAFALSCVPPSVEFSYATATQSKETYLLGTGTLVFDQTLMPRSTVGVVRPAEVTRIPAKVSGMAFTGAGFDQEFEADVELIVRCILSWCPTVASEKEHLLFLKQAETNYELALNPCGGAAFPEPTPEMLDKVLTCFKDGNCSTDPS